MREFFRDIRFWFRLQFKRIRLIIRRLVRFFAMDLWDINEDRATLSKWKTRLLVDLRIIFVLVLSFSRRRIAYQATSLAFRTILAMVPFLAVILFILSQMGFGGILEGFITSHLSDTGISHMLVRAADNLVRTSTTSLFGFISTFSFFWILIVTFMQVVRVFDNVWGNVRKRSWGRNMLLVFLMILMAPMFILVFIGGFLLIGQVTETLVGASAPLHTFLNWFTLGLLVILILSLLYKFIPSVKVHYRYALRSAIISGTVFTLLQYLYFGTQVFLTGLSGVYGYFAAIPLFMLWLNLGWNVILYGAGLTYAIQAVRRKDVSVKELEEFTARVRERIETPS